MLVHVVIASPLTASYDGPYKAIFRSGRVIKILMKGKVETVTVDHVEPAHFEREPESGTTTRRQSKPKPKSTTPKPAAITRKPRKVRERSSSITTLKSLKMEVDKNMTIQTRSSMLGIGESPAVALHSDATRAHLPRPPTVYKALHSRTTSVSCANGDSGSF